MSSGIERRAKRELSSYCLIDRETYEDLTRYAPGSTSYRDMIQSHLPADWALMKERIWYHAIPANRSILQQGFKIHLSATQHSAREMLRRALPILVSQRIPFKVVVDEFVLNFVNSKNYSRSGSGKFITIYPHAAEFEPLLGLLAPVTSDLSGPFILSDKPYNNSRAVFYRYGVFQPNFRLNVFGEREPIMTLPNGETTLDLHTPYFSLPQGVSDPFPTEEAPHEGVVILNNRYKVESTITISNCGGVYKARDFSNGSMVIVKEARPHINLNAGNPSDAIETLKKEHHILCVMQDTGYVPRVVDLFKDWEHLFLVEEYVPGVVLSSFRALNEFALLLRRTVTTNDVGAFCDRLRRFALNLVAAVKAFHSRGIIVGDLTPANLIVDVQTLKVTVIDLEGAHIMEEEKSSRSDSGVVDSMVTLGYVAPWRLQGNAPSFKDDYYAIGSVIYNLIFPVQVFFSQNPPAAELFIKEITRDYKLPAQIRNSIMALLHGDLDAGAQHLQSPYELTPSPEIIWPPVLDRVLDSKLEEVSDGITDYLLSNADFDRQDRLWPSDYRIFSTNPLSLAFGALGPALYLKQRLGQVPENIREWISCRELVPEKYAPGFYIGASGIAWALSELGMKDLAFQAMDLAYQSPLLGKSPDLFYGLAGIGLASLYFWHRTGQERFLQKASEIADRLLASALWEGPYCLWKNVDGHIYSGYAHGASGIALFLLMAYLETRNPDHLQTAIASFETEISRGIEREDYMMWERIKGDGIFAPYWRYGTAGVGSVAIRFYAILQDEKFRTVAEKAARYVMSKYAVFPGQMVGLAGLGEFLLDMYQFTGRTEYLLQAHIVASGVLLYQVPKGQGIVFPGEELVRISADFATGASGIGAFFHRLLADNRRPRMIYDCQCAEQSTTLWEEIPV